MWQEDFIAALRDSERGLPSGIADDRRFNVYRNNVMVSLMEALEDGFPLVQKLVGADFFRALARQFCTEYLPTSPVILWYGAEFGDFLESFPPAQQIPYLADMARLEYAERRSLHAADTGWFRPESLEPAELLDLRITLHPSVHWLHSGYPLFDIWYRTRQDDHHPIGAEAQDIVIHRPGHAPLLSLLPRGGCLFLERLRHGDSFARAAESALDVSPEAEPTVLFPLGLQLGELK